MIKTTYNQICLALALQVSFAPGQVGQAAGSPQFGETQRTPAQRAAMDEINAKSTRAGKVVQPLLKMARALWDSGDPLSASMYYDMAATKERVVIESVADTILEESLVAQGRYREAARLGRQYGPTVGEPSWLIISDCEIGEVDEAGRFLAANWRVSACKNFAYELPTESGLTAETIEATAWLLQESAHGVLHSPQARLT